MTNDMRARPSKRIGPRPLGLHLGLASTTLSSALAALPLAVQGSVPWLPELEEEASRLQSDMQEFDLPQLMQSVGAQGHFLVSEMLEGIQKYHGHPYQRSVREPRVIRTEGAMRLLDYAPDAPAAAPIAFIVPSLVNRDYILDLSEKRSFVRALAAAGVRPILVSWGAPGPAEAGFGLDDYILKRLTPALDYVRTLAPGGPVHLIGYCMGGTLAVALAQLQQERLASLITLAAPWDFHKGLSRSSKMLLGQEKLWQSVADINGEMPVDILQSFFTSLDPGLCLRKFGVFNRMEMDSVRAEEFVALEDWLNDGVPLTQNAARDCFSGWYGKNQPFLGAWAVGAQKICPQTITIPVMVAAPKSDKIVPSASALALADQIPSATVITPPSGHIGMVAGSQAPKGLWLDIMRWIKN